ncbi:MAG: hypothetical protein OEN21_00865 [Myxococcales bacterium]|nr:hypothetical protein [Myxococcales bacterium]
MKSRFRLPAFVLGVSLFLISCSSEDSAATGPNIEVDPFGDNGVFLKVLPPGSADANDGNIATDPNSTNQLVMYENLVFSDSYPTPGQLDDGNLVPSYFKDELFLDETAFDALTFVTNGTNSARIVRTGEKAFLGAIDQALVALLERFIAKAQSVHGSRAKILDQHVRAVDEA